MDYSIKPRIKLTPNGLFYQCKSGDGDFVEGLGLTPAQAYAHWQNTDRNWLQMLVATVKSKSDSVTNHGKA